MTTIVHQEEMMWKKKVLHLEIGVGSTYIDICNGLYINSRYRKCIRGIEK